MKQNKPFQKVEQKNKDVKLIDVSEFRGLWNYFVEEGGNNKRPDGYLVLGEGEEPNSISGRSISETVYVNRSNTGKQYSHVGMYKLTGSAGKSAQNETIISFSIPKGNLINKSRAMLSADKKNLIGTTTRELEDGVKIATYNWSAVRQER